MRPLAHSIQAVLACTLLSGCVCGRGPAATSMLVVNRTGEPIAVSFSQDAANAEANPVTVDQRVLPGHSVRFSGVEGDRMVIRAGTDPAMVVGYAKRAQVVCVSNERGAMRYELRKGFNE